MTTRPEFGVPHPCYSGAAFYHRTADAFGRVRAPREYQKAPQLQMLLSRSPVTQGQCAISTTDAFCCIRAPRECSGALQTPPSGAG